ncbi:MAG: Ppx/GppA phosphatase family protein [Aeromicrobium sp.]|uniref:Ppx/GppA phosphatase family protein n=1 Tax=Aeromicrobium sp. TaxID=1871063 RepID=UPI0039E3577D
MTRVAAIDCGTNSIRLLVTDFGTDGTASDVIREMRIVRLGEGVDRTGRLDPAAIERTLAATREYALTIGELGVDAVRFCATSAARDAENASDFRAAVVEVLGVEPEILTGEAEAHASFLGATGDLGPEPSVVADIGGGSTELVRGAGGVVESAVSLDIGSVRLTERFLASDPPSVGEIVALEEYLDEVLGPVVADWPAVERLIGVAGTVTTVTAHALQLSSYDSARIHGARIPVDQMREACVSLVSMPVADRRHLSFMHPGRADVIGGGALILDRLLDLVPLAVPEIVVSERDILDGIARSAR